MNYQKQHKGKGTKSLLSRLLLSSAAMGMGALLSLSAAGCDMNPDSDQAYAAEVGECLRDMNGNNLPCQFIETLLADRPDIAAHLSPEELGLLADRFPGTFAGLPDSITNPDGTGGDPTDPGVNGGTNSGTNSGATAGGTNSGSNAGTNSGATAGGTSGGANGGATAGGTSGGTNGGTSGGTNGGATAGGTSGGTNGGTSGGTNGGTSGGTNGGTSGGTNGGTSGGTPPPPPPAPVSPPGLGTPVYGENGSGQACVPDAPIDDGTGFCANDTAFNLTTNSDNYPVSGSPTAQTALSNTIGGLGGNDIIRGFECHDTLFGNDGDDQLYGGKGIDTLYGGKNTDYLYGGMNNDTLRGELGTDHLHGQLGSDTYVYRAGDGTDFIQETDGALDKIVCENGAKVSSQERSNDDHILYMSSPQGTGAIVIQGHYSGDCGKRLEMIDSSCL